MAIIKTFLFLLFALSIGHVAALDFEFYDSMDRKYSIKTMGDAFKEHYGRTYKPFVIVVETQNANDKKFKKQILILNSIDGEDINSIFVIANQSEVDKSGYHVMPEMAKKISDGHGGFRIRIIGNTGKVLSESSHNMEQDEILKIVGRKTPKE